MGVDLAVDVGDQPLAVDHHLARALAEEGLVGRPEIVAPDIADEEDGGEQEEGPREDAFTRMSLMGRIRRSESARPRRRWRHTTDRMRAG